MTLVILGCGYVGTRLARTALAAGRAVRACSRSTGKLEPLKALGVEVKYVDASNQKHLTSAMSSMSGGTVVYSIPPVADLPPGRAMRAALQAAYGGGATCFVYLSSAGLYGDSPDDDVWIDEDTPVAVDDGPMANVRSDEAEIDACSHNRLRVVTLRLAPVYGPGRGVRMRLHKGDYRLLDGGTHAISRIHVDDAVAAILAAEAHGPDKSRFLVADDEPTTQLDYATWLTQRMGLPMPPSRTRFEPGKQRVAHRNRRIRNARMKAVLGVTLTYPTFREGEAAIEAELQG
ncbi:MAG: NAD(P)H-binding protein [Deltaproteobacteria bacterium]|nr:NAD(P)H-binding protein [Deltaproteobacteria bacterium]